MLDFPDRVCRARRIQGGERFRVELEDSPELLPCGDQVLHVLYVLVVRRRRPRPPGPTVCARPCGGDLISSRETPIQKKTAPSKAPCVMILLRPVPCLAAGPVS